MDASRHHVPPAPAQAGSAETAVPPPRGSLPHLMSHWMWWLPVVGGGALLGHFLRIGYTPTLAFADIGTVLGAMLVFMGLSALYAVVLLLAPLVVWKEWIDGGLLRAPPRRVGETRRMSDRAYRARSRRESRGRVAAPTPSQIRFDFGSGALPSFFTAGAVALVFYVAIFFLALHASPDLAASLSVGIFVFFLVIVVILTLCLDKAWLRRRLRVLRRLLPQWGLLLLSYLANWPILLLPFLLAGEPYLTHNLMFALAAALLLLFVHWFWFVTWRIDRNAVRWGRMVTISAVLLVSLLPVVALDASLKYFGLGMMSRVDVVLTPRGCVIARAAWPGAVCLPVRVSDASPRPPLAMSASAATSSAARHASGAAPGGEVLAYRLQGVDLLTRIGTHLYLAAPGGLHDASLPRFPVPAEDVLSWRRLPPPAPKKP